MAHFTLPSEQWAANRTLLIWDGSSARSSRSLSVEAWTHHAISMWCGKFML